MEVILINILVFNLNCYKYIVCSKLSRIRYRYILLLHKILFYLIIFHWRNGKRRWGSVIHVNDFVGFTDGLSSLTSTGMVNHI